MIRHIAPLHDWQRHHPAARKIANEIAEHRDMLRLRTRAIIRDVMTKHCVSQTTAFVALRLARGVVSA